VSRRQTNVQLVRTIRASLPGSMEWSERDETVLAFAEAHARDLDALEADIAEHGVRLEGGKLNTAFCEARQARVALGRLIGLVDIPDEASTASLHAAKAARARWQAA
jgi:hypothetical protein